jgi:23S rRNA (pseudouridine1915-N3)-methyltransferase
VVEREIREAESSRPPVDQRRDEARRLEAAIPERATVIALDREGTAWSSEELADRVRRWREAGNPVALVLGGSLGLDPELVGRAAHRWSLGPLTLPHELARVVVVEQWYRAWTILRNEKYHK